MEQNAVHELSILSKIDKALDTRLAHFDLVMTVLLQHEKNLDELIQKLGNLYESTTVTRDLKKLQNHDMTLYTCAV